MLEVSLKEELTEKLTKTSNEVNAEESRISRDWGRVFLVKAPTGKHRQARILGKVRFRFGKATLIENAAARILRNPCMPTTLTQSDGRL